MLTMGAVAVLSSVSRAAGKSNTQKIGRPKAAGNASGRDELHEGGGYFSLSGYHQTTSARRPGSRASSE